MCHIYSIECKPARAIYPAKDQHCTTVKELLNLHAALFTGNEGIQEKTKDKSKLVRYFNRTAKVLNNRPA